MSWTFSTVRLIDGRKTFNKILQKSPYLIYNSLSKTKCQEVLLPSDCCCCAGGGLVVFHGEDEGHVVLAADQGLQGPRVKRLHDALKATE